MKTYEITDIERREAIGMLLYYEREKTFIAELKDDLDEWTAPLLFAGLVKKNIYTVPRDLTLAWVRERLIPPGRQNIDAILSRHHLREYDEMKMLELSEGKCSQDPLRIKKTDTLPDYVLRRMKHNLTDVTVCDNGRLLCFFNDGSVRLFDLRANAGMNDDIAKILSNSELLLSGKVGTGGYFVTFNDSIDIPAALLYDHSAQLPLTMGDFLCFVRNNIRDTAETCRILGCTRQNLAYMQDKGQLNSVKSDVKGNLFLKGDVMRNMW